MWIDQIDQTDNNNNNNNSLKWLFSLHHKNVAVLQSQPAPWLSDSK